MSKNDLTKAFDQLDIRKRNKDKPLPGILGFMLNGKKTVEVPTRPGFVFVRLRNTTNELIQAYNGEVSPVYDLPVLVDRDGVDKSRYRVIGRDLGAYQNWGSSSGYLPRHGPTHSFSPDTSGGGDIVFVYGRQMMPLAVMQSGSSGAGCAYIESGIFYQAGKWVYAGNTGTANLLPAKPSAGNARMLLVYLDENGNPGIATGTVFSESLTGTASIIPYLPNVTSNYYIPLAGIRLTNDTTAILWDNIYDVRPWIVGDGFIPTGSFSSNNASYVTMSSSSGLTAERVLTAGDGISITDGGANSTVTIAVTNTGTSVSQSAPTYPAIYDDNTFKATGTAIHFNDNLVVAVTGTSVWIDGQAGGGASTPTYPAIYDDGTFKSTGTAIHFNDNLSVVSTGTSVWIDAVGVTGTAGTPGASGPPGSNTILIYDDSVFKVTGSAVSFDKDLQVGVTGSIAYVSILSPVMCFINYNGVANQAVTSLADVTYLTGTYTQEPGYIYKTTFTSYASKVTTGNLSVQLTDFNNTVIGSTAWSIQNGYAFHVVFIVFETSNTTTTVNRKIRASDNTGTTTLYKNTPFTFIIERMIYP